MEHNNWTVVMALITACLVLATPPPARSEITKHFGMCDASAAVPVGPAMFVVANDEDNRLRVYRRDDPGAPVSSVDLTSFLNVGPKHPEADIEGATRIRDRIYWITSHGRNKNGKPRPSRHRLFATEVKVSGDQVTIVPVGKPYRDLLKDLTALPWLKEYRLGDAAEKPPEEEGGLNIEGLSATPDGALLIGFRNPVPNGKALLVPLKNPKQVVDGKAATLGRPISLSLGGLGIRSIEYFEVTGKYLIVAGPPGDDGDIHLYQWSGPPSEETEPVAGVNFSSLHPEALIVYPEEKSRVQVLSDDGSEKINGKDCKDEDVEPTHKYFRSVWISP
ncbi:DUF3616 domain-containing protein [Nitrospira sp. Nam80]